MKFQFQLFKFYYKYINPSIINHYKLLLLTEEYRDIGNDYLRKYPTATNWINLNQKLFDYNKQAEIDFMESSKNQNKIKKEFFENREIICKNCKNKDYIICSDSFQKKYLDYSYRYEQCTELIINEIKKDIHNNNVT